MDVKPVAFAGRLIIVGCGGLGRGLLPLILRHVAIPPDLITVIDGAEGSRAGAEQLGVRFICREVTRANYRDVLAPLAGEGDFLLNLAPEVSSLALIALAWQRGALYLDPGIEPWSGGYTDPNLAPAMRSSYALRESALALKGQTGRPTAVLGHGANPGLVSHFVKQALADMARDSGSGLEIPAGRQGWAELAERLGIAVIQITQKDSQVAVGDRVAGEFTNTWSAAGLAAKCCQPAEIGWGSHERATPPDGRRHEFGRGSAIYLMRQGGATRVRSWTPSGGPFHGLLLTSGAAISISDTLTLRDGARPRYRPGIHVACRPCDTAFLSIDDMAGNNWRWPARLRTIAPEDIMGGGTELGVLLMGHGKGGYWFGSRLSVADARALSPHANAATLPAAAGVLAGMVWAMENPRQGIIEAEDVDFARALAVAEPYLGHLGGDWGDWTPLVDRDRLFPEDIDSADPWLFKNFRVS